jgi:cytochrome c oxidase assembly protein subunit 15
MSSVRPANLSSWHFGVGLAVLILFCQIALGGWVSANYAGIACIGFPTCNGLWIPHLEFSEGFNLLSPAGANYQGGVLDANARVTIQFIHRMGAVVTAGYIVSLSILLLCKVSHRAVRVLACLALLLITMQFFLGIMNVMYLLPITVAVAHNAVAAMLMATMLMMLYLTNKEGSA